jgi:hypothetical protein
MSRKTIVILVGNGGGDKPDLITPELRERLIANGRLRERDHVPVVKLFHPVAGARWLITEMLPSDPDIMFGLCDLGLGFPELGYVCLSELENIDFPSGFGVERDLHFDPKFPLTVYAYAARRNDGIVEDEAALKDAATLLEYERRKR